MTENNAAKKQEVITQVKERKPLHPNDMLQAEYAYLMYYVVSPSGVKLKDLQDPAYWCHVAQKFNPGTRIEVDAEDGSFYAKLKVTYCDRLSAHVVVLDYKELSNPIHNIQSDRELYHIRYNGPTAKWCVVRKADKVLLEKGMNTQDEAEEWLKEYFIGQGK